MKWEYDLFAFQDINGEALKAALNQKGNEGWEYCGQSAAPVPNGIMFIYLFKRPVKLVQVAIAHP